jgi:hypothetical protein
VLQPSDLPLDPNPDPRLERTLRTDKNGASPMLREQMEKRVAELDAEYRSGQEMLAQVETRRAELQQTLLRISGALQVIQELLAASSEEVQPDRLAS